MENINLYNFDPMEIGEEIRQARRLLDITQGELCKMVNNLPGEIKLSQREVSMLEQGKGNPTLNKLEAIAKVLNREWKLQPSPETP